jgi:hypothetical protein
VESVRDGFVIVCAGLFELMKRIAKMKNYDDTLADNIKFDCRQNVCSERKKAIQTRIMKEREETKRLK